jgi:hypothetical protein
VTQQQQESEEEISEAQAEHTPSFFSQRFASDLIRPGQPEIEED